MNEAVDAVRCEENKALVRTGDRSLASVLEADLKATRARKDDWLDREAQCRSFRRPSRYRPRTAARGRAAILVLYLLAHLGPDLPVVVALVLELTPK